jgi:fructokinase
MRIGIDLGGTKIEIIAIDPGGRVCARRRVQTPRGDYGATIRAIHELTAAVEAEVGRASVGIGIPGVISPATGLVKNANSTWLNGQLLLRDLTAALGREVRIANDANCFALSEATDGAAAGAHVVFGVILGTGTGGGVVVAGRVLVGPNAIAGEWGHNPMPWPADDEWPGPQCYCGRTGCIETFLSGPALAEQYRSARGVGESVDAASVEVRAAEGDAVAERVLARYAARLGRALASVMNVLDPDVIVLGGGLSNLDRLYQEAPAAWARFVFSDAVTTRLVRAAHGDSSGVRGAAWLW